MIAIAHAPSLLQGHDRTGRSSYDLVGRRSKEHQIQRVSSTDAHDDEIGLLILSGLQNSAVRLAVTDCRRRLAPGPPLIGNQRLEATSDGLHELQADLGRGKSFVG